MNRGEIRSELAFLVNFSESTAAQDFVQARLNKAIQQAYRRIIEAAKINGSYQFFHLRSQSFTWAASTQTLAVPDYLINKVIIDLYDITDGEPGFPIAFGRDSQDVGLVFWADYKTWQWATVDGPGSAMTLRAVYEAVAEELVSDGDVPQLIPSQFHDLVVWEAAILLRKAGDEAAPPDWKEDRDNLLLDFYKHVSRGRPTSHVRQVLPAGGASRGAADPAEIGSVTPGAGLNP